jgi:hypothetical protein
MRFIGLHHKPTPSLRFPFVRIKRKFINQPSSSIKNRAKCPRQSPHMGEQVGIWQLGNRVVGWLSISEASTGNVKKWGRGLLAGKSSQGSSNRGIQQSPVAQQFPNPSSSSSSLPFTSIGRRML